MKRVSSLAPDSTVQGFAELLSTAEFDIPSVRIILHGGGMSQEGGEILHDDSVEGGGGEGGGRTLEQSGVKHGDIVEAVEVDKFIERAPTPPSSMPVPPQSNSAGVEVSPPLANVGGEGGGSELGGGSGGGNGGVGEGGLNLNYDNANSTTSDEEFARMLYESQMSESENMMFEGEGEGGGANPNSGMRAPDERRTERLVEDAPSFSSLLTPAFTSTLDSLAALDAMMSNRLQTGNQDLYDRGNDTFARMAARRNREISEMLNMAMSEGGEGGGGGGGGSSSLGARVDRGSRESSGRGLAAGRLGLAAGRGRGRGGGRGRGSGAGSRSVQEETPWQYQGPMCGDDINAVLADLDGSSSEHTSPRARPGTAERDMLASAIAASTRTMSEESRVTIPDPDDDVELQRALMRALDEQNFEYEGIQPAPAPVPEPVAVAPVSVFAPSPAPRSMFSAIDDNNGGAYGDLLSATIAMSMNEQKVEEQSRLQQDIVGGFQSEEDMIAAAIAASLGTDENSDK